jgi:hypothetical protein
MDSVPQYLCNKILVQIPQRFTYPNLGWSTTHACVFLGFGSGRSTVASLTTLLQLQQLSLRHHILYVNNKMKLLCIASLLATAAAFTTSGAAFTTQSHSVGQRSANVEGNAHRSRKATIVMDGKANGT